MIGKTMAGVFERAAKSEAMHRLLAAHGIVALLLLSACGGPQTRYADHLKRGERLMADGKLEKAQIEFRNAIQVEPKAPRAHWLSGRLAELSNNPRAAIGQYLEAVELDPNDPDYRASLGRLYLLFGAPDRALETVERGLTDHPDSAALLTVRGAVRAQRQDMPSALADAERALKLAPDSEDAVALVAALHERAGEREKAIAIVEAASAHAPKSVGLHEVLANLYLNAGNRAATEAQMRRIIALEPQRAEPRYRLATLLVSFDRLDDAQKVLQQAVVDLPSNQGVKLVLTDFIASKRSRAEGEQTLRAFVAREPSNLDLRLGLGALLERSGATVEAVHVYRDIIDRDPRSPKALIARDRIAAREASEGHFDEASKMISDVIERNPQDADALTLRGNIELQQGNPTAAVTDLRAVLRDQPGAVEVRRSLARAHLALGEPQLAEDALRAALATAPNSAMVRTDLAQLLAQTGRMDAALALLEEGVEKLPKSGALREALVRGYLGKRDYDSARRAADSLVALLPQQPVGDYLAGVAADGQKRPEDAERYLRAALQLQPAAVDVLAELAQLEIGRGRAGAALDLVRSASDANPKSPPLQNLLGEVLTGQHQYPAAIAAFRGASALAPSWWLPWRNLALVHRIEGDLEAAIADDEAGLKAVPNDVALSSQLAGLYEDSHRIDDAVRVYETLLAAHPRLDVAANNLAMLLLTYRSDAPSLARAAALTAPFAKSTSPAFLDTYGWALYKNGKYAESLAAFQQASVAAPPSDVIRYHLAMAELQTGQREKARNDLAAALARSGSFTGAAEARTVFASLSPGAVAGATARR